MAKETQVGEETARTRLRTALSRALGLTYPFATDLEEALERFATAAEWHEVPASLGTPTQPDHPVVPEEAEAVEKDGKLCCPTFSCRRAPGHEPPCGDEPPAVPEHVEEGGWPAGITLMLALHLAETAVKRLGAGCPDFGEATEHCDCLVCRTQMAITEWEDDPRESTPVETSYIPVPAPDREGEG